MGANKFLSLVLLGVLAGAGAACDANDGPVEQVGEDADEAVEDMHETAEEGIEKVEDKMETNNE